MTEFQAGPFDYIPTERLTASGAPALRWQLRYGHLLLAERVLDAALTRDAVLDAFQAHRATFVGHMRQQHAPAWVSLIDSATDEAVGGFASDSACGMTVGGIDDRSRYWLRSADRRFSRPVTLGEFAQAAVDHAAPPHAWIAGLLPADVLARDPGQWRAPTHLELRHVVGEHALTGVPGAHAAALIGVTPQNFRKYTAREGAATRQKISYAMWHLLLQRLGVQRA